jgi:multidrug transporter EmrE-like cation transporter
MIGATLSLFGALAATAAAQVTYKAYSLGGRRIQLVATILLFGVTPVLTYVAVKAFGIGLVYIATSLTYILVSAAGWLLFAERPSVRRIAAMAFIFSGILVYGLGL